MLDRAGQIWGTDSRGERIRVVALVLETSRLSWPEQWVHRVLVLLPPPYEPGETTWYEYMAWEGNPSMRRLA